MRKVGVKALKNELSKHLRAVAAGETILVTDRSRVIAELRPPPPTDEGGDEAAREWARMIHEGIVTPAKRNHTDPMPPRLPPLISLDELIREIDADREDR
jgi:antitoxin (DNA-binding transcriptional repressor) of toxin-antitoxin stability system